MSARRKRAGRPLNVDPETSARLGRVRQSGTAAEEAVAAMLRQLGVRAGRSKTRLPGSPDFVNVSRGWCIFVHGCFWHAHPGCRRATVPKRNRAFWEQKFADNRRRDARVLRAARALGFRALVLWECEVEDSPGLALRRLGRFLSANAVVGRAGGKGPKRLRTPRSRARPPQ
jgi:DNA mismatch endonuclease (patch repair protein)